MTARELLVLLEAKHAEDLFIAECKNGPTQQTGHLRLDAWALKRSWANPCSFGYEIKVSRSDWMRDQKLEAYLPLCHRFHIVCPVGLIQPEEVPAGAGLLWASSTGSRLYTKRKATHRDIEWPVDLLLYVLFARVRTVEEARLNYDKAAYWRQWLERKGEDRELGIHVGRQLRELVSTLRTERDDAVRRYAEVEDASRQLKALGLDYLLRWARPEAILEKVMGHLSAEAGQLSQSMASLIRDLDQTKGKLDAAIARELQEAAAGRSSQ